MNLTGIFLSITGLLKDVIKRRLLVLRVMPWTRPRSLALIITLLVNILIANLAGSLVITVIGKSKTTSMAKKFLEYRLYSPDNPRDCDHSCNCYFDCGHDCCHGRGQCSDKRYRVDDHTMKGKSRSCSRDVSTGTKSRFPLCTCCYHLQLL